MKDHGYQGGGAKAKRKAKKKAGHAGHARHTMGMGHTKTQTKSDGAMGKHQSTGDGGSSDFNDG